MTNIQAKLQIGKLRQDLEFIAREHEESLGINDLKADIEALTLAEKLLDKHTQKQYVVAERNGRHGKLFFNYCPVCEYELFDDQKYCSMCGQKVGAYAEEK